MFQKYRLPIILTGALLCIGMQARADQLDGLAGAGMFMMAVIAAVLLIIDLPIIKEVKSGDNIFLKIVLATLGLVNVLAGLLFIGGVVSIIKDEIKKHNEILWAMPIILVLLSLAIIAKGGYSIYIVFKKRSQVE